MVGVNVFDLDVKFAYIKTTHQNVKESVEKFLGTNSIQFHIYPRLLVRKRTAQNKTRSNTSPATDKWTAIPHTDGHRLA